MQFSMRRNVPYPADVYIFLYRALRNSFTFLLVQSANRDWTHVENGLLEQLGMQAGVSDADSPGGAPRELYQAPRQEGVRPPVVGKNAPRISETAGESAPPRSPRRTRETAVPDNEVSNPQPLLSDELTASSAVHLESSAVSTPTRVKASVTTAQQGFSEDHPPEDSPGQVSPGERTPAISNSQDFDVPQTPSELLSHLGIGYYSKVGGALIPCLISQG